MEAGYNADVFEQTREMVVARVEQLRSEDDLEELLEILDGRIDDDLVPLADEVSDDEGGYANEEGGYALLAAADSWASLASYAVGRFYRDGPVAVGAAALNLPGVAKKVTRRLRRISARLQPHLQVALNLVGASSFSIGVSVPWAGISISLTWP